MIILYLIGMVKRFPLHFGIVGKVFDTGIPMVVTSPSSVSENNTDGLWFTDDYTLESMGLSGLEYIIAVSLSLLNLFLSHY